VSADTAQATPAPRVVASEFVVEIDEECDRPDAPDDAIHHADGILLARRIAG
jgi:hypothetical protein